MIKFKLVYDLTRLIDEINKNYIQHKEPVEDNIKRSVFEIVKILNDVSSLEDKSLSDSKTNSLVADGKPSKYKFREEPNFQIFLDKIHGCVEECLNIILGYAPNFIKTDLVNSNLNLFLSSIYKEHTAMAISKINYLLGSYLFNHEKKFSTSDKVKHGAFVSLKNKNILIKKNVLCINVELRKCVHFLIIDQNFLEKKILYNRDSRPLIENILKCFSNINQIYDIIINKQNLSTLTPQEDDYRNFTEYAIKMTNWEINSRGRKILDILNRAHFYTIYFLNHKRLNNEINNIVRGVDDNMMAMITLIEFGNEERIIRADAEIRELEIELCKFCSIENKAVSVLKRELLEINRLLKSIINNILLTAPTNKTETSLNWYAIFQYMNNRVCFDKANIDDNYLNKKISIIYDITKLINLTETLIFEDFIKIERVFKENLKFVIDAIENMRPDINDINNSKSLTHFHDHTFENNPDSFVYNSITDYFDIKKERQKQMNLDLDNSEKKELIYQEIQKFHDNEGTTVLYGYETNQQGIHLYVSPQTSIRHYEILKSIVLDIMPNLQLKVSSCEEPTYEPTTSYSPGTDIVGNGELIKLGLYLKDDSADVFILSTGHSVDEQTVFSAGDQPFAQVVDRRHDTDFDYSLSKILHDSSAFSNTVTKNNWKFEMCGIEQFVKFVTTRSIYKLQLFRNDDQEDCIPAIIEDIDSFKPKFRGQIIKLSGSEQRKKKKVPTATLR